MRQQGVSGEDFLTVTQDVLVQELRLSLFTAKKLARLRDEFVAAGV